MFEMPYGRVHVAKKREIDNFCEHLGHQSNNPQVTKSHQQTQKSEKGRPFPEISELTFIGKRPVVNNSAKLYSYP